MMFVILKLLSVTWPMLRIQICKLTHNNCFTVLKLLNEEMIILYPVKNERLSKFCILNNNYFKLKINIKYLNYY